MKHRSQITKGNQFEYSCYDSLKPIYPDINLTKHLGFVRQFDLVSEEQKAVFECKKHKGFSWNELIKFFKKLQEKAKDYEDHYLIFQANRQPTLVLYINSENKPTIRLFKDVFGLDFIVH
jgi:hypothetical protein